MYKQTGRLENVTGSTADRFAGTVDLGVSSLGPKQGTTKLQVTEEKGSRQGRI